jgi:hypothetical protein
LWRQQFFQCKSGADVVVSCGLAYGGVTGPSSAIMCNSSVVVTVLPFLISLFAFSMALLKMAPHAGYFCLHGMTWAAAKAAYSYTAIWVHVLRWWSRFDVQRMTSRVMSSARFVTQATLMSSGLVIILCLITQA